MEELIQMVSNANAMQGSMNLKLGIEERKEVDTVEKAWKLLHNDALKQTLENKSRKAL